MPVGHGHLYIFAAVGECDNGFDHVVAVYGQAGNLQFLRAGFRFREKNLEPLAFAQTSSQRERAGDAPDLVATGARFLENVFESFVATYNCETFLRIPAGLRIGLWGDRHVLGHHPHLNGGEYRGETRFGAIGVGQSRGV